MSDAPREPGPGSDEVDRLISLVLRAGVALSTALIVAGTVVSFVRHREYAWSHAAFRALVRPAAVPRSLADVARGVAHGRGQALVAAGLLVLIATPVARVALSVALFWRAGDRRFAAITAVVLGLLALSFLLGRAGG